MGSCSSVHRNSNSVAKFNLSPLTPSSKTNNKHSSVPASVVETKTITVDDDVDVPVGKSVVCKSQVSPMDSFRSSFGRLESKEEIFFDTRSYMMDSDCDDFYSVNGDFTPSRGSTPVHASLMPSTQSSSSSAVLFSQNRAFFEDKDYSSPSPTRKRNKKKLVDLFRDSIRIDNNQGKLEEQQHLEDEMKKNHLLLQQSSTFPLKSTHIDTGERTQMGDDNNCSDETEEKSGGGQCCFPRLVSVRSLKKSSTPSSTPSHPRAIAVEA